MNFRIATAVGWIGMLLSMCEKPIFATESPSDGNPTALFLEPGEQVQPSEIHNDPFVVRRRTVSIDRHALPTPASRKSKVTRFNLFADLAIDGLLEQCVCRAPGNYTWRGRLADEESGTFILSVRDQAVVGIIRSPARGTFQIRCLGGRLHEVQELDLSKFLGCDPSPEPLVEHGPESDSTPSFELPPQTEDVATTIDLMVLYTPAARAAAGGSAAMEALVNLAIDDINEAYQLSLINPRVRLVHQQEVAYAESGDMLVDLQRLQNPADGFMDPVHSLRETYGADAVSLLVTNANSCGIAYTMTALSTNFATFAFSVVNVICVSPFFSMAHELGHNEGCEHDIENALHDRTSALYPYAYGWRFLGMHGTQYRTIMAQSPGDRIQRFSNPNVSFDGMPTGVEVGQPDQAYNALVINNTGPTAANWRATKEDDDELSYVLLQVFERKKTTPQFDILLSKFRNGGKLTRFAVAELVMKLPPAQQTELWRKFEQNLKPSQYQALLEFRASILRTKRTADRINRE